MPAPTSTTSVPSPGAGAITEEDEEPSPSPTPVPAATASAPSQQDDGEEGDPAPTVTPLLAEVIKTRTPEPTATPGLIQREVAKLVYRAGLSRTQFLGLAVSDWLSLLSALLIVLAGHLIGTWAINKALPRVVRRTPLTFDDRFLQESGNDVRWLVLLLALHLATNQLAFFSAQLKTFLKDVYFVVGLLLATRILFRTIQLASDWSRERMAEEGRQDEVDPLIVLLSRVGRALVALLSVSVLLSHFGINVTALATVLGIGGLALSLAAQDTVADMIAGFIILVDRPFRIGDRIEIQGAGTWGDVVDIGLRTTRIRTRDNRMVIVPNSVIGKNQVINYAYPDPTYRIETRVGIAYGTDIEGARGSILDAVSAVEGVLVDRPVDVLYVEMGESAMIFRVRWWIQSYADTRRIVDRVHTALQGALDQAGLESPYPTQSVNLRLDRKSAERLAETDWVEDPM
ncbi:MAG: mechanosensitive ion channel domain-containing protein [Anaerolineae bacterium]